MFCFFNSGFGIFLFYRHQEKTCIRVSVVLDVYEKSMVAELLSVLRALFCYKLRNSEVVRLQALDPLIKFFKKMDFIYNSF